MDGVTILATKAVNCEAPLVLSILAVILLGAAGLFGVSVSSASTRRERIFSIIAVMVTGFCYMCVMNGIDNTKKTFDHYEYKVVLEDYVSYNDFTERYEVLDTEGEILTVIDKVFEEGME